MKTKVLALILALLMLLTLCACGSSKASSVEAPMEEAMEAEYNGDYYAADTVQMAAASGLAPNARGASANTSAKTGSEVPEIDPEKIIYSANATVETTDFEAGLAAVEALVERFDAWIESSSVNGSNFYDISRGYASTRSASYTLRVPSERFQELMGTLSEIGNVPYTHVYTENVSAQYYDTQARMEAYKAQEARLLEMMDRAESVDDLISIESRLSDLRYEIESLQTSLNQWDRRVAYSSVYLELQEVREYTQDTPVQLGFGERLGRAFRSGIHGFVAFCQDAILWLAESLPALVLIALVLIVLLAVRKNRKKKKAAVKAAKQD